MKACLTAVLLLAASAAHATPLEVVVLDIEPFELAPTVELRDLIARESAVLRRSFADEGLVVVEAKPRACDDCAHRLGADLEVETTIQEIQYPSFNVAMTVRDVATHRVVRRAVEGIDGLEDEDWDRDIARLVKQRLLARPLPADKEGLRELVARIPDPVE